MTGRRRKQDIGHDNIGQLQTPSDGRMTTPVVVEEDTPTLSIALSSSQSADINLCPMCQTPLPGLGKSYGRVYHGIESVMRMNETLGMSMQEPFDFNGCSHSGECIQACKVVKTWCLWYGPCSCVNKALERGWWEYEAGSVCDASMLYWKGCDCV